MNTTLQVHNHTMQNTVVLPSAANGQVEEYWENTCHRGVGVIGMVKPQDRHHVDVTDYNVVDYRPLPLSDPPTSYVFPDEVVSQGNPAQGRPNVLEHDHFSHVPQHVPSFPARDAFPDSHARRDLALGQSASEDLREVAIRYLRHPDYQVDLMSMEVGARGNCQVIIVLKL